MGIKDYGKLTKLQIKSEDSGDFFEVMFNPESYSETFAVTYQKVENVNGGLEQYRYVKTPPQDFKLKLIIDGTGVSDYDSALFPVAKRTEKSVYDRVNQFLKLAWYPVESRAIPLQITWGSKLTYYCMLKDVTINYTLFDREGNPLRAELDVNFIGNPEKNQKQYELRLQPDKAVVPTGAATNKTQTTTSTPAAPAGSGGQEAVVPKTPAKPTTKVAANRIVISVS